MSKLIKLDQVIVDANGELTKTGHLCVNPERVVLIRDIWDKLEVHIKGACIVSISQDADKAFSVAGNALEVMEKINEALTLG